MFIGEQSKVNTHLPVYHSSQGSLIIFLIFAEELSVFDFKIFLVSSFFTDLSKLTKSHGR